MCSLPAQEFFAPLILCPAFAARMSQKCSPTKVSVEAPVSHHRSDDPPELTIAADRDRKRCAVNRVWFLPQRESFFRRKYVVDRLLGGVLLVISSPLTLLLFLLVKLNSRGPGFYRQQRVGLNGKTFDVIKLRSMVVDAERSGQAVWCVPNDTRVTRLGHVLRTLHLDELPQLFNVAMGDMCLVGPRPERPGICERLAQEIDGYYDRNSVKPGITGLAQINLPPDMTTEDVRRKQILDLNYIAEANAWLDVRMLGLTALYMFGVKGDTLIKVLGLCRQNLLSEEYPNAESNSDGNCSPRNDVELAIFGNVADSFEPVESTSPRQPR
jgi:lipopolysaccharide/colanic/teichoic acid biosynthesis glycosyltransferase